MHKNEQSICILIPHIENKMTSKGYTFCKTYFIYSYSIYFVPLGGQRIHNIFQLPQGGKLLKYATQIPRHVNNTLYS